MILMNKKRILLFIFALLISIIIYLICSSKEPIVDSLQVANMGFDKKTVILDPRARSTRLWSRK